MDRRGVLKGLGVAAAAALWPGWVREAFAAPRNGLLESAATLLSAIERARARRQPLLVFVIPEDDRVKYFRGRHFGEWLNHGADADLAPLACADAVCAGMDALRALLPGPALDGEQAILLLDASAERMPGLGVVLAGFSHRDSTLDEGDEESQITACIRATGAAVRRAIFGDLDAVKRRAAERWSRLTSEARAEVRRIYDGVDGSQEGVLAAAPLLAVDAVDGDGNAQALGLLARAARVRYCGQPIPGSEWAQTEDDGASAGEVGHVPSRSRRFLYFPTRSFQDT